MKVEYEIKWWKDWLEADMIERIELVIRLPFVKSVQKLSKSNLSEEHIEHSIGTMLNGFFEDLEQAIYVKQELEEEQKNENTNT